MKKIFVFLCAAGAAALLLTPLVVSASASEGVIATGPSVPTRPTVIQITDDGETAGPGYLGVEVMELTDQLRLRFGVPEGRGVLVSEVSEDSAAARAGIEPGDVLVSIAGEPVSGPRSLRTAVAGREAGAAVPLVVVRERALVELEAVLESRPSRWAVRQRSGSVWDGDGVWSEEQARRFEELGERISRTFEDADWGRLAERWEGSDAEWERFGERMERLGERLGERMEQIGERIGHDVERRVEAHADRFEMSGEEWERFGEEMERLGDEWSRFGEELGRSFEDVDWEGASSDIAAAVREVMGSIDWDHLRQSIHEAVSHPDVH